MQHIKTGAKRKQFEVLAATKSCQAARMTLRAGATSGPEVENEHPRCEQWLFVISGNGVATIGKRHGTTRRIVLKPNSLLLIEKGELHQIRNVGKRPLSTINFYVPPAYGANGEPRASAKKRS